MLDIIELDRYIVLERRYLMAKKNQHVTPHAKGWQVKGAGNNKATAVTKTQYEAIQIGREISKKNNSELVIHGRDGKIRDKDSYGNDPIPPRDKKF